MKDKERSFGKMNRYIMEYSPETYMIRIIDTSKEEPNGWSMCNIKETVKNMNDLNDEMVIYKELFEQFTYFFEDAESLNDLTDNDFVSLKMLSKGLIL